MFEANEGNRPTWFKSNQPPDVHLFRNLFSWIKQRCGQFKFLLVSCQLNALIKWFGRSTAGARVFRKSNPSIAQTLQLPFSFCLWFWHLSQSLPYPNRRKISSGPGIVLFRVNRCWEARKEQPLPIRITEIWLIINHLSNLLCLCRKAINSMLFRLVLIGFNWILLSFQVQNWSKCRPIDRQTHADPLQHHFYDTQLHRSRHCNWIAFLCVSDTFDSNVNLKCVTNAQASVRLSIPLRNDVHKFSN